MVIHTASPFRKQETETLIFPSTSFKMTMSTSGLINKKRTSPFEKSRSRNLDFSFKKFQNEDVHVCGLEYLETHLDLTPFEL